MTLPDRLDDSEESDGIVMHDIGQKSTKSAGKGREAMRGEGREQSCLTEQGRKHNYISRVLMGRGSSIK